jgi:hypothetical protein
MASSRMRFNRDRAALDVPAKNDLGGGDVMGGGDGTDPRLVEEDAAAQRHVALSDDALGLAVVEHRSLGEEWVELDLVDRRRDAGLPHEAVDMRRREVRDPDGADARQTLRRPAARVADRSVPAALPQVAASHGSG